VALVPRIQEDSSFVFPFGVPGSLVCEHKRNEYRIFLSVNIKYYLSHIKVYKVEFVSLRRRVLRDYVKFINFAF